MTGTFTTVPVERFAIWRQLSRVDGVLSKVQTRLPILPGLQTLAIWNGWAASIFFGTACFELAYRLAMELGSYAAGEVDGRTLTEDIFIASGSGAAWAKLCRFPRQPSPSSSGAGNSGWTKKAAEL